MDTANVWWVNQGVTYRAARDGGFLWAPLRNKAGRAMYHWESMDEVRPGDIVLHYADSALRAVSKVTKAAIRRPSPPEIARDLWQQDGRYVETVYHPFEEPLRLGPWVNHPTLHDIHRGPIDTHGGVKQGYLFYFSLQALAHIMRNTEVNWPDYVLSLVETVPDQTPQNAWIFQGNPRRYDVFGAVSHLSRLTWTLHQYSNQVRKGDTVYIWESGKDAGVIAVGTVLDDPTMMTRLESEIPYYRDDTLAGSEPAMRAIVEIQNVLSDRITRDACQQHPVLSGMHILRQPQGTVFPLTTTEAMVLQELTTNGFANVDTVRLSVQWSAWNDMVTNGYASAFPDVPAHVASNESVAEVSAALDDAVAEQYPNARYRAHIAEQFSLFRSLQPGDHIIATHGTSAILGVGIVQHAGYTWDDQRGHTVAVAWDISVAKRVHKHGAWRMAQLEAADDGLLALARRPGPDLPTPNTDLAAICEEFSTALGQSNIRFGDRHHDVVRSFVVSLATKRFVILTGLSGSGKTQLAVRFGEWLGEGHSRVIAVRPDWTGSEALFGYEDALHQPDEHGRRPWHVPEALEFMLHAARDPEHPYMLVLDEMNLAHVERYFADVLSGMESEQPVLPNLVKDDDGRWRIAADGPEHIAIPDNLFVVGTVNVDETTYMFSPKVLDRANTLEFRVESDDLAADTRRPLPMMPGDVGLVRGFLTIATDDDWHVTETDADLAGFTEHLRALHRGLAHTNVQFGHRVVYEANRFAGLLAAAGEPDMMAALDLQVLQKVLPRVHGSKRRLQPVMSALGRFCFDPDTFVDAIDRAAFIFDLLNPPDGEPKLPGSFEKLVRMARQLQADQFTSFAE